MKVYIVWNKGSKADNDGDGYGMNKQNITKYSKCIKIHRKKKKMSASAFTILALPLKFN